MEERYGLQRQSSGLWRSLRDGDFEEEDVWDVLKYRTDSTSSMIGKSNKESFVSRNTPTAARMIPRATSSISSSNNSSHEAKIVQQSAPVNIPDWSEVYGKGSKKSSSKNASPWLEDDNNDDDYNNHNNHGVVNDGDEEEEEYDYKVPPHEFIARRLARSQISSFSVFEGVGRTLKGRDLSKVRNAILTKTGFLESP